MKIFFLYSLLTLLPLASEPTVKQVGKAGSVASSPPPEADHDRKGDTVAEMMKMELNIIPSALENKAVPTNQWWTRLAVDSHVGALWVCPMMLEPKPESLDVYFPQSWNGDGRSMNKGKRLQIRSVAKKAETKQKAENAQIEPIVIGDFEEGEYAEGWEGKGEAFGEAPSLGTNPSQTSVSGFSGKGLVNSFLPNDSTTGSLLSPEFSINRDYLHFLIGGGKDENKLRVDLKVEGEVIYTATGINSERLENVTWDLKAHQGKSATLEIVDEATGGWGHILADHFILNNKELASPAPSQFIQVDKSRALRWGDWTMSLRHASEEGQGLDVTVGRGMPLMWIECLESTPVIEVPEQVTFRHTDGEERAVEQIKGSFILSLEEKSFGVHLPEGSSLIAEGKYLYLVLPEGREHFSVSLLPSVQSYQSIAPHAFSIPRGSEVNYEYLPSEGVVKTLWKVELDALEGGTPEAITGWLPHHVASTHSLSFLDLEYECPRGLIRCAAGKEFSLEFPFEGLLPMLPFPPKDERAYSEADADHLTKIITDYSGKVKFGGDTYWGGKDLLRCAQAATLAKQMGHPKAEELKTLLREGLENWYTWSPGEKDHFFTWYPRWGGLVGLRDSYGSFKFTDQHFHYGYFTTSSALMALLDDTFLSDFGEISQNVAQGYANWKKDDTRFPRFRTFDFWEGHSWAGGFSSSGGNNQESSSEAIQSWAGIFLLGSMMGDAEMQAAGAMGYTMERSSTFHYWLDQPGFHGGEEKSCFPPPYERSTSGILFANGIAYATYFSGDPAWIHGIQWFPPSPWQDHLASDPALTQHLYRSMMTERKEWFQKQAEEKPEKEKKDSQSVDDMGGALGNVIMGFLSLSDPKEALTLSRQLVEKGSAVAKDPNHIIPLAHAASRSTLGHRIYSSHTSLPTSACYSNGEKNYAVLLNPSSEAVKVTVFTEGEKVSEVSVPAGEMVVHSY